MSTEIKGKLKFKVGDKVHVDYGIINYIGKVESIFQNPSEKEIYYVVNNHCYEKHDLKKVK